MKRFLWHCSLLAALVYVASASRIQKEKSLTTAKSVRNSQKMIVIEHVERKDIAGARSSARYIDSPMLSNGSVARVGKIALELKFTGGRYSTY